MDRNVWCEECGKYVGCGHEHSSLKLSLEEKSIIFQAAVDRILQYGDHPKNIVPEELAEAMEILGDSTLTDGTPYYSPTIQAAYKYIESQEANIIKTAKKLHEARHEIMTDNILTLASKTNGHIGVGQGKIRGGRRIYDIEDYGYNIDEDSGVL